MTTINTKDLAGDALDWAVASIEYPNDTVVKEPHTIPEFGLGYEFTANWNAGGPIIERERISTRWDDETLYGEPQNRWLAESPSADFAVEGPTPLIAAMRCYVASKLGDSVDVPELLA